MARRRPHESHEPDDEIDHGPSDEDLERFGDVTRACPECGTELYDDAEVCWKCGHAIGGDRKKAPLWIVVVVIAVLVAFGLTMAW